MAGVVSTFLWIPLIVFGSLLGLLGITLLLSRVAGGRYLVPIVKALSRIPLLRRLFERMSTAALERTNPELASAVKKMRAFGEPTTPQQVQRALALLTPAERRAYMEAVGEQASAVETTNRAQRRQLDRGQGGLPTQRPGTTGRRGKKRR